MSYEFKPRNKKLKVFRLGAFSWPVLLETFGYLFPELSNGARYYLLKGIDKRFDRGMLSTNDGFPVTAEEARIMARMTRNYVAIQRSLDPQDEVDIFAPSYMRPWPLKIREDFVDKFERFAEWAEKSKGFRIY